MKRNKIMLIAGTLGLLIGIIIGRSIKTSKEAQIKTPAWEAVSTWEWKDLEPVKSKLKDTSKCWLCGEDELSLMGYFRKFDDVGIICSNNWYILDLRVRDHDDEGNFTIRSTLSEVHLWVPEKVDACFIRIKIQTVEFQVWR